MSAIAAILLLDERLEGAPLIEGLTRRMSRRGPDAREHWAAGRISLGHCMLRSTPESLHERQPTCSRDGNLVIVMDGRLDNLDELRRELNTDGSLPAGTPDALYVLAGYERWGPDVTRRLLGDFAFIIWDQRAQLLHCANDCMGAKPLWFVKMPQFVAFASDEEAFIGLPGVEFRPSEELIASMFVVDMPMTAKAGGWNENIIPLETGEQIIVDRFGHFQRKVFGPVVQPPMLEFRTEADARHAFSDVFSEALRCRMRANGGVAALMSGGMDSAAIAAFAPQVLSQLGETELATFSAVSESDESCIESDAIRALIAARPLRARMLTVPSLAGGLSIEELVALAWDRTHPTDNSLLVVAALGAMARSAGHRVLLSGVSGDVVANSPTWYAAPLLRRGRLIAAWRECRAAQANHTYLAGSPIWWLLFRNAAAAFAPTWIRTLRARLCHAQFSVGEDATLLNQRFLAQLDLPGRRRRAALLSARYDANDWQSAQLRSVAWVRQGIGAYDRVVGQLGLEARDPWADRRVVDFFLALPLRFKVSDGRTKYLARSSSAPVLPEWVPWRTDKTHVGWKVTQRVMQEHRPTLNAFVENHLRYAEPYLDVAELKRRCAEFASTGGLDYQNTCYTALVLMRWLKRMSMS